MKIIMAGCFYDRLETLYENMLAEMEKFSDMGDYASQDSAMSFITISH